MSIEAIRSSPSSVFLTLLMKMNLSGLIFLLLFSVATAELRWVLLLKDKKINLASCRKQLFCLGFFLNL